MIRGPFRLLAVLTAIVLMLVAFTLGAAEAPANEHFQRTWARTDQLVANGSVARTWIWGPEANTSALNEDYAEATGGTRQVQYFDKSRMEVNNPAGDPASPFYVTNGLLVIELMTGKLQLGHNTFEQYAPSTAKVAGDQDDPNSPTYASLAALRSAPALADGAAITQRLNANGSVSNDPALGSQNVTAAFRVNVPGIDHQVASPFWEFLNSSGQVVVNGQSTNQRLFDPWFYATGYPITEAYWADVKIAGTVRLVLMQCFERRCLTYTPGNPSGFLTEAGNVGQHYYSWRYEQGTGQPTSTSTTATSTATETTATATSTATENPGVTPTTEPATTYDYVTAWGQTYSAREAFDGPVGVTEAEKNDIWVVDSGNHRLVQYYEHGVASGRTIGSFGTGNAQFNHPTEVAFSDDERMYVVDQNNHRVQVIGTDGYYYYLTQWGSEGTGNGQFKYPTAIAVHNGIVYVVDRDNNRVQMFDLTGVYQGQFGSEGTGSGQFQYAMDIAIDAQGNVYVTDQDNNRVQKFSSTGSYISQFGSFGYGNGQFDLPRGIEIDDDGFIYVADHANHRVQKFNADGVYVAQWGEMGIGHNQFYYPEGIAIDSDGNVYVASDNRVQKFTNDGDFLYQVTDNRRGYFSIPTDITLDQNGNLLIADSALDLQTLARYTPDGVPLDDYSLKINGAGPYDRPDAAAVSKTGDIYVVDSYANRVQRFSSTWGYKNQWGTAGTGPGQFNGPQDIAIDADGNVYVVDSMNNRAQKFDANGVFLDQWGGVGTGDGQFNNPASIAIDGERIYVADLGNDRVQVFDRDGDYLAQWGSTGSAVGQFSQPIGIAVNPDGYVLVVEYTNNRVQVFTPEGEAEGMFGTGGMGGTPLTGPLAVVVDADGFAYVTEVGNHRVHKFSPAP